MNDKSYVNWSEMSDSMLVKVIGAFVKHHRLQQNTTQGELAHAAGVSRSTLSLMEKGEAITVPTLIQVLRVLDLLYVMDAFKVIEEISPLALAKQKQHQRKRARKIDVTTNKKSDW